MGAWGHTAPTVVMHKGSSLALEVWGVAVARIQPVPMENVHVPMHPNGGGTHDRHCLRVRRMVGTYPELWGLTVRCTLGTAQDQVVARIPCAEGRLAVPPPLFLKEPP